MNRKGVGEGSVYCWLLMEMVRGVVVVAEGEGGVTQVTVLELM